MHTYYVSFVNPKLKSEVYTVSVQSDAPRKAIRKARRKLANLGVVGLHANDVYRYRQVGVNENGALRLGIVRFGHFGWKY